MKLESSLTCQLYDCLIWILVSISANEILEISDWFKISVL